MHTAARSSQAFVGVRRKSGTPRAGSTYTAHATPASAEEVAIPATRKQVVAKHTGNPRDILHVISTPIPDLQEDEVLVKMKFLGVNGGHDTFLCLGKHIGASNQGKTDFPVGAEGCGIVVATGPNVTSVRPGDAVSCSLARYNDYSVFSERMLCKVPEASAEVAAVALSGLFGSMVVQSAADIKPGQTVFVTAGAGAAGSFIVQFARMAGAQVVASVGSAAKAAAAEALGARAINYHDTEIGAVLAAEYPGGLDWVVDGVGGELQETLIGHMAPGATLLQIGYISEYPHTGTVPRERPGRPRNDETMWGGAPVDLGDGRTLRSDIWPKDMSKVREIRAEALNKLASGELKALVDVKEFHGLESVVDAIEYMLTGAAIGKVVVRL